MRIADRAAATDVGYHRTSNEDAYFAGDAVFAVADGMGGHLAGEVASATALEPIADTDGKLFPDAAAAQEALRVAVVTANAAVVRKSKDDPRYRGMGTTLTAAMVEGRRLHVAHVGDSRAYILREGEFSQLTMDHSLVARLVREGRLTEEEAAHHPQRSVITRAIGIEATVDVDTMSLELLDGDQILLCSDGLSGVVTDTEVARALTDGSPAEVTVATLIALAKEHGGPDNITAVLIRFADDAPDTAARRLHIDTRPDSPARGDWARELGRMGALGRPSELPTEDAEPRSRRTRLTVIGVAAILLLVLGIVGGRWLLSRSVYVGVDDEQVAIHRGIPANLGPISLSWVVEPTGLMLDDVCPQSRDDLRDGISAADLETAREIVTTLRARTGCPPPPNPRPSPSPLLSPSPTPPPTSPRPIAPTATAPSVQPLSPTPSQ